jgi:hypothetical protein
MQKPYRGHEQLALLLVPLGVNGDPDPLGKWDLARRCW